MVFWIASAVGLAIAYLFGSIPTGYLAGKLLRGIDIREHGSKSTGATNVLRTLGKWPALVVLLVDVLKGVAAIIFARWFYPWLYTLPSVTPEQSHAWGKVAENRKQNRKFRACHLGRRDRQHGLLVAHRAIL